MRVALATCSRLPDGNDDVRALAEALAGLDVRAEPAVWGAGVDWSRYDLVVIRTTWDYTHRPDEFLAWADRLPRVLNPAPVLRWNTDKRYLRDLADAGVPVVPTRWDPADVPSDWPEFVIKPAVSAGSRDTARWSTAEHADARAHLRELRDAGRTAMVQPYLSGIDTAGETALVFIDGEFSHAARKAPILAPGTGVQGLVLPGDGRGGVTGATATGAELDVAHRALAAVPDAPDLLYARVDLVPGPGGDPVVLELELAEPNLFLHHGPGAVPALAKAVSARL
ncbi:ATP-grasp domain-containing protein [Actinomadura cremea]|nr:ATP-grasp domain-containing protein [Actinomadura cremea]